LCARLVDIFKCAKFYRNQSTVLDFVRGRILTIPIGIIRQDWNCCLACGKAKRKPRTWILYGTKLSRL